LNRPQDRLTLLIESADDGIADEAKSAFAPENVSASSNFVGGVSLAVFFLVTAKTLHQTLKTILDFIAQRSGRYEDAEIVVEGRKLSLKGYGPADVEQILSLPAFEKFR